MIPVISDHVCFDGEANMAIYADGFAGGNHLESGSGPGGGPLVGPGTRGWVHDAIQRRVRRRPPAPVGQPAGAGGLATLELPVPGRGRRALCCVCIGLKALS